MADKKQHKKGAPGFEYQDSVNESMDAYREYVKAAREAEAKPGKGDLPINVRTHPDK